MDRRDLPVIKSFAKPYCLVLTTFFNTPAAAQHLVELNK
jgi:hypothetical protein